MAETVVLVHGIWMSSLEMGWMQARLGQCGFEVHRFHYRSLREGPVDAAAELHAFLAGLPGDRVHLVGHSLGGIVLLHLFDRFPDQRPGNVVLMGSPVRGSAVAQRLAGFGLTRSLLGRGFESGLNGDAPAWAGGRPLGVLTGTRDLGVGRIIGGLEGPCDGTVAVAETLIENAADTVRLRVSHMGMLFSRPVADQVCHFLRTGRFFLDPIV